MQKPNTEATAILSPSSLIARGGPHDREHDARER